MFSCFIRFLLVIIACLAIAHAYPSSIGKAKWIPSRNARPHLMHDIHNFDYLNSANEHDTDLNDSNGFATWLFRSRKFCCAPPL